jgi:hypothetical protein
MDVLPLLEADHRVVMAFTVAPTCNGVSCHGTEEFLRARACLVLPWEQVIQCDFDLVLAMSADGLAELHGLQLVPREEGAVLMPKGRMLALAHGSGLAVLREACPDALPTAAVVGDVCYDRLLASIPFRARYRQAFGLARDQKLVVVSATWQPEFSLGSQLQLSAKLLEALPSHRYRVAAVVPLDVWSRYGRWQVSTWYADCLRAGLILVPPDEAWRAALIAADLLIGDHGPVTRYGAAIGLPVMTTAFPEDVMLSEGTAAVLYRHAPRLRADQPLPGQVRAAMNAERGWQDEIARRFTSEPGRAGERLRTTMYELLGLDEPGRAVPCSPVPLPQLVGADAAWWWAEDCSV